MILKHNNKKIVYFAMTCSVLLMGPHAYALQAMTDNDLRQVEGQDGISVDISYSAANIDQLYWDDQAGSPTQANAQNNLRASLNHVTVAKNNPNQDMGLKVKVNAGSSQSLSNKNGLDLDVQTTLGKIQVGQTTLCNSTDSLATCQNNASFGQLSIQSDQPIGLHLTTTDGLLSKTGYVSLSLALTGLDIALSQKQDASVLNSLLLHDLNFNMTAKAYMYIDADNGWVIQTNPVAGSTTSQAGYVDFMRDGNNKSGINYEVMLQPTSQQGIDSSKASGIFRVGANGRMINAALQLRGTNDSTASLLGRTNGNSIAGDSGLALRFNADFTNDKDILPQGIEPTTLELGGAGNLNYAIRFANNTPLQTRKGITGSESGSGIALNTDHAGIAVDGVYLNLVNANQINLPTNTTLLTTALGSNTLVNATDYLQTLSNSNTPYLVLAVRGLNYSAIARRGQFIYTNADGVMSTISTTSKWGLGTPIYNLNANLAFTPIITKGATSGDYVVGYNNGIITKTAISNSERIGFNGTVSTQGVSSDGAKTTSIMLIDGGNNLNDNNNPIDYYIGLRNIDMLFKGSGSVGFENGNINLSLPKVLFVMSAQLASGYLPGAKYQTCPVTGGCYAPSNSFTTNNDVLAGIKMRLAGAANLAIIPRAILTNETDLVDGVNALSTIGLFEFDKTANNVIQIIEPTDGSTIGFDNIVGTLAFDNKIIINSNSFGLDTGFNFNPEKKATDVLRIKNVNFYPAVDGTLSSAQRLGEIAVTGGRLTTEIKITPRDGSF